MTRQPAATAFGAYSRDTCAPAQNSARSQCAKSKSESSCTGWLRPRKLTLRPRERLLASAYSCATGKPRSSRTDRKSGVEGKSVDLGGRRIIKKKKKNQRRRPDVA